MANLVAVPKQPAGVNRSVIVDDKTQSYVVADGYSLAQSKILSSTNDDVELEVSFKAYDKMERDSAMTKCKKILITSVLADDLQLAPGATEDEVGEEEYETYVEIMEFCERLVEGLDRPYRTTMEQLYGNSLKYGHGVAETEWEYRLDAPSTKPKENEQGPSKGKLRASLSKFTSWMYSWGEVKADTKNGSGDIKKPALKNEKVRLMPKGIKVKPRNATRFVVDDYMNVLGLAPANKVAGGLKYNEIVDREKFLILTLNQQDEDPRGKSSYRPAVNWYNLKSQVPAEMLRFILEESVPKAVGTLPPQMPAFEFERDENNNIVYEDPETKKVPKMLTGAESFKRQIEGFRSGGGAVIPHEAKLEPYKKGMSGSGDAQLFRTILKTINNEIEDSMLLQTLAQSEGEHQARSASEQVAEVLYNLVFWTRWQLAMVTLFDLFGVAVKVNFGDWAIRYLPIVSFGDFNRRDWIEELKAYADAYFKGLLDDTQRPEIMANMNLPKPGPSRQELGLEAAAQADVNGEPVQPNGNRPDKQAGTKNRNQGNGTEKKNAKQNTRRGLSNGMGHNSRWFGRFKGHLRTGRS